MIAVFTNRGARLKSWRLKHYLDQTGRAAGDRGERSRERAAAPLHAAVSRMSGDEHAEQRSVRRERRARRAQSPAARRPLTFEYRDTAGACMPSRSSDSTRRLHRERQGDRDRRATGGCPSIHWGPRRGDVVETGTSAKKAGGPSLSGREVTTQLTTGDIATQAVHEGDFRYAGVDDNYFMTVVLFPGRRR